VARRAARPPTPFAPPGAAVRRAGEHGAPGTAAGFVDEALRTRTRTNRRSGGHVPSHLLTSERIATADAHAKEVMPPSRPVKSTEFVRPRAEMEGPASAAPTRKKLLTEEAARVRGRLLGGRPARARRAILPRGGPRAARGGGPGGGARRPGAVPRGGLFHARLAAGLASYKLKDHRDSWRTSWPGGPPARRSRRRISSDGTTRLGNREEAAKRYPSSRRMPSRGGRDCASPCRGALHRHASRRSGRRPALPTAPERRSICIKGRRLPPPTVGRW
jgi:hypothetical protein